MGCCSLWRPRDHRHSRHIGAAGALGAFKDKDLASEPAWKRHPFRATVCTAFLILWPVALLDWLYEKKSLWEELQEKARRKPEAPGLAVKTLRSGDEYRRRDGHKEAKGDIARGTPKLKAYGLPSADASEWREVLKERLGIEVERITGCVVNVSLASNHRGCKLQPFTVCGQVAPQWSGKGFGNLCAE